MNTFTRKLKKNTRKNISNIKNIINPIVSKKVNTMQQKYSNIPVGTGFYETLKIKPQTKKKKISENPDICKKIGNIKKLINKKYMIPSQFPNITKIN